MPSFENRARIVLALVLTAATPLALAQKMYKCSDGKGGTTFQQAPCPETAAEADARTKEKERVQAEEAKKKEDAARKKEDAIQKAKDRDKAYQDSEAQRAEERKKAAEAEKKIMEGARQDAGVAAGTPAGAAADAAAAKVGSAIEGVPTDIAALYPGDWRDTPHGGISTAFKNNQIKGCGQYKFRNSANQGGPMLVQCTEAGSKPAFYYVYPTTGGVTPARF
jgi:flagellar biosynthesis GTPase FlhF